MAELARLDKVKAIPEEIKQCYQEYRNRDLGAGSTVDAERTQRFREKEL